MVKRIMFASLVLAVVAMGGAVWAQGYTINDVMKEIADIKVEIAGMKSDINWLRNVTTTFFVALFAALSGLFYFVFDISRSLRVPKEERVSKLEAFMENVKTHLHEIDEKLHLPKSVLVFLLSFSILFTVSCLLVTPSWSAIPQKINLQGEIR